jgi:5'-methylthioadenosine phosphorylase
MDHLRRWPNDMETFAGRHSSPLAVIGGSGLYDMPGLTDVEDMVVETPYGATSDAFVRGRLGATEVLFLARHGRRHSLLPTELPQRANFWALASLGVREVLSISAVGSLRAEVEPLHAVVPDQLIDRTNGHRPASFFGEGVVAHVSMDEPFCSRLGSALSGAVAEAGAVVHAGGTLIVIEGPAFSTHAESAVYQSWGASIIGMTALPEAKLAREAGMCYATLASVTDYDTWHPEHSKVTVDLVLRNLKLSAEMALAAVRLLAERREHQEFCSCCDSLRTALVTPMEHVPQHRLEQLAPILSRYGS